MTWEAKEAAQTWLGPPWLSPGKGWRFQCPPDAQSWCLAEDSAVLLSVYEVRSQSSWEILMEPATLGEARTSESLNHSRQLKVKSQQIKEYSFFFFLFFSFFFFFFFFLRATPAAYGSSQARGLIRAANASLHHSHSNVGSEPGL